MQVRVVLVVAAAAALAPLAGDALGARAAAGAVPAGALPPEALHGHAAQREELVGQLRAPHRHQRLALQAGGERGVARKPDHPAWLTVPLPQPKRLRGRAPPPWARAPPPTQSLAPPRHPHP